MGLSGRIARFFLTSQLTPLLALVAVLLGLFAVLVTPREEEPQINVTMANVLIPFPGASAQRRARAWWPRRPSRCCRRSPASSTSIRSRGPGMAVLTVQFKVGVPRTEALVRLYDMHQCQPGLGAARPRRAASPSSSPRASTTCRSSALTLWSRDATARRIRPGAGRAHARKPNSSACPARARCTTIGGPGRAVRVCWTRSGMRERRRRRAGPARRAAGGQRRAAVGQRWSAATAQMLACETGEFLRSARRRRRSWWSACSEGRPVYLRDVASVDGRRATSRSATSGYGAGAGGARQRPPRGRTGYPAVTLAVTKKPGENAVDVAEQRDRARRRRCSGTRASRTASRSPSPATTARPPTTRRRS